MLLCSVTREISLKKRVSRGEVAGLSPRKLETVWTLFKLVNLVPIVSVSNKNLNFAMLIIFYAINPLGLIIHCLYFSCVDTFFNQLYVGTSDRILRTVFAVVNRKKRADCGKSLFATYGDKIQPSKVDIPEHSGSSSRVLCQTTEDRPRLSVEVPGRENRSLWQEKEGDRKEAKKIRAGHRSSGKELLIFFTWMKEPRTVVHTKRCYGNFPVSLVKHAQENCQKIQDLKECNRLLLLGFLYVWNARVTECIKMFFHSKCGWEWQWSVAVRAKFTS